MSESKGIESAVSVENLEATAAQALVNVIDPPDGEEPDTVVLEAEAIEVEEEAEEKVETKMATRYETVCDGLGVLFSVLTQISEHLPAATTDEERDDQYEDLKGCIELVEEITKALPLLNLDREALLAEPAPEVVVSLYDALKRREAVNTEKTLCALTVQDITTTVMCHSYVAYRSEEQDALVLVDAEGKPFAAVALTDENFLTLLFKEDGWNFKHPHFGVDCNMSNEQVWSLLGGWLRARNASVIVNEKDQKISSVHAQSSDYEGESIHLI